MNSALRVVLCLALLSALPVRAEALLLDCPHCAHVPATMAAGHVSGAAAPADHDASWPDCCRTDGVQVVAIDQVMVHEAVQGMHVGHERKAAVTQSVSRNAAPVDQCVCSADQSVPPLAASASLNIGHGLQHLNGPAMAVTVPAICPLSGVLAQSGPHGPPGARPSQPLFLHTRALLL